MRKHSRLILALVVLFASVLIFASEMSRRFSGDHAKAREYKDALLSAIKAPEADLELGFPKATVCFVPEGRYAPYYVKEILKSDVAYSEGDDSSGYWFALVKDNTQAKTWILIVDTEKYEWKGEDYVCPKTITTMLHNGKTTISLK